MHFFFIFLQKNLEVSKKYCNFAAVFEKRPVQKRLLLL